MSLKPHLRKYLSVCIFFLCFFGPRTLLRGEAGQGQIRWQDHETKYTVLRYQQFEDIRKFDSAIDFSPDEFTIKGLFSVGNSDDPLGSLDRKIDALYERVQEILDMRKKIRKVGINIYPTEKQFHSAYYQITWMKRTVRSWYLFEKNTIYIDVNDVHEGILAHEMAHAIIDNYLDVRPPRATAEILATYVDQHLFD